eukprot:m.341777 g.341777  ORF g.341777 m.341777 type:complete len:1282 (-) comp20503_c0_seq1:214-4059(-)
MWTLLLLSSLLCCCVVSPTIAIQQVLTPNGMTAGESFELGYLCDTNEKYVKVTLCEESTYSCDWNDMGDVDTLDSYATCSESPLKLTVKRNVRSGNYRICLESNEDVRSCTGTFFVSGASISVITPSSAILAGTRVPISFTCQGTTYMRLYLCRGGECNSTKPAWNGETNYVDTLTSSLNCGTSSNSPYSASMESNLPTASDYVICGVDYTYGHIYGCTSYFSINQGQIVIQTTLSNFESSYTLSYTCQGVDYVKIYLCHNGPCTSSDKEWDGTTNYLKTLYSSRYCNFDDDEITISGIAFSSTYDVCIVDSSNEDIYSCLRYENDGSNSNGDNNVNPLANIPQGQRYVYAPSTIVAGESIEIYYQCGNDDTSFKIVLCKDAWNCGSSSSYDIDTLDSYALCRESPLKTSLDSNLATGSDYYVCLIANSGRTCSSPVSVAQGSIIVTTPENMNAGEDFGIGFDCKGVTYVRLFLCKGGVCTSTSAAWNGQTNYTETIRSSQSCSSSPIVESIESSTPSGNDYMICAVDSSYPEVYGCSCPFSISQGTIEVTNVASTANLFNFSVSCKGTDYIRIYLCNNGPCNSTNPNWDGSTTFSKSLRTGVSCSDVQTQYSFEKPGSSYDVCVIDYYNGEIYTCLQSGPAMNSESFSTNSDTSCTPIRILETTPFSSIPRTTFNFDATTTTVPTSCDAGFYFENQNCFICPDGYYQPIDVNTQGNESCVEHTVSSCPTTYKLIEPTITRDGECKVPGGSVEVFLLSKSSSQSCEDLGGFDVDELDCMPQNVPENEAIVVAQVSHELQAITTVGTTTFSLSDIFGPNNNNTDSTVASSTSVTNTLGGCRVVDNAGNTYTLCKATRQCTNSDIAHNRNGCAPDNTASLTVFLIVYVGTVILFLVACAYLNKKTTRDFELYILVFGSLLDIGTDLAYLLYEPFLYEFMYYLAIVFVALPPLFLYLGFWPALGINYSGANRLRLILLPVEYVILTVGMLIGFCGAYIYTAVVGVTESLQYIGEYFKALTKLRTDVASFMSKKYNKYYVEETIKRVGNKTVKTKFYMTNFVQAIILYPILGLLLCIAVFVISLLGYLLGALFTIVAVPLMYIFAVVFAILGAIVLVLLAPLLYALITISRAFIVFSEGFLTSAADDLEKMLEIANKMFCGLYFGDTAQETGLKIVFIHDKDNSNADELADKKLLAARILFLEFFFETIPQITIQITNNTLRGAWTPVGIIAFISSVLIVASALWTYTWLFCLSEVTDVDGPKKQRSRAVYPDTPVRNKSWHDSF